MAKMIKDGTGTAGMKAEAMTAHETAPGPMPFSPRLDILPGPQRALWPELAAVPPEFTLYGGTALALHLGHRESVDFDFFGTSKFDTFALASEMAFLEGAEVMRREKDTLDLSVIREGGPVKLSFFGLPSLPRIRQVETCPENGLRVASLLDLAGTKVKTVQERAEAKDYADIAALVADGRVSLPMALAAGAMIYGAQFNPQVTLKALAYFGDGNLRALPEDTRAVLTKAVGAVDLMRLPAIDRTGTGTAGRGVDP